MRIAFALLFSLIAATFAASGANAACNPANAPPNSVGCQPAMPSNLTATDMILGWRPSLGAAASRSFVPSQLLQAGLPAAFSTLTVTGGMVLGPNLSLTGNLSVGGTSLLTGDVTMNGALTVGNGATILGTTTLSAITMGATTATGFGFDIAKIPAFIDTGNGFASFNMANRFIIRRASPAAGDFADLQMIRNTTFTGGSLSNINGILRTGGTIGANDATINSSVLGTITTNGAAGGYSIGGWFQATRSSTGRDHVWASIHDVADQTGLTSSAVGHPTLSMEVDHQGADADNLTNGAKFGGVGGRHFVHFMANRLSGANPYQLTNGLWFDTNGLANVPGSAEILSVIGFSNNTAIIQALDTRGVQAASGYTDPIAAVRMSATHIIDFNGGAALNSNAGNYLQYTTTGTSRLRYMASATEAMSIDNSGNTTLNGSAVIGASVSGAKLTISAASTTASITAATSGTINVVTGGAGNVVNIGNAGAGLGQALTVTSGANGNTFGGASPNIVAANNKLTAQWFSTPGNTITYSGSSDPKVATFNFNLAGSSSAAIKPVTFNVSSDTFDASGSSNAPATVSITHNVGGAGTKGGRILFLPLLNINSAISGDTTAQQYQPIYAQAQATVNVGGTNTTTAPRGSLYGNGSQAILYSGATNWTLLNGGGEMDIAAQSGSSVRDIYGMSIVLLSGHAVAGSRENSGLVFANQTTASRTWTRGISFGNSDSDWPTATTAALIGTTVQINYANQARTAFLQMPRATYGVDWLNVDFSQQSGYGFRSPGFSVDGTGQAYFGGGLQLATTSNGYKVDVPAVNVVTAIAINTAGTGAAGANNYYPNDIVFGTSSPSSGQYLITHTKAIAATVVAGGSGGVNGACTITGTTGTGTKFQATGTVTGGVLGGALTVSVAGDYTVNPTSLAVEPVTGCSLTGATVSLGMGVLTATILVPDVSTGTAATITPTGGSGTGLVLTPTWSTRSQIDLNSTGGKTTVAGPLTLGSGSLTVSAGSVGLSKITASAAAPGAGGGKIELVCGTTAGTAKLIAYAGTSGTATTILDNIGTGVTGC